jgi:hypothetical protein
MEKVGWGVVHRCPPILDWDGVCMSLFILDHSLPMCGSFGFVGWWRRGLHLYFFFGGLYAPLSARDLARSFYLCLVAQPLDDTIVRGLYVRRSKDYIFMSMEVGS